MNTTGITMEHIAQKVRRRRPLRNLSGELIALDSQQLSIVRCMCEQGLHHKHISREIGISPREVSRRVAGVLRITGTKSHAQLGAWAVRQGLV